MLNKYLTSPDCTFHLPADINEYLLYTDHRLSQHLATEKSIGPNELLNINLFEISTRFTPRESPRALWRLNKNLKAQKSKSFMWVQRLACRSIIASQITIQLADFCRWPIWSLVSALSSRTRHSNFRNVRKARRIERIYVSPERLR